MSDGPALKSVELLLKTCRAVLLVSFPRKAYRPSPQNGLRIPAMTQYFVEYSSITNSYIVHREKCITYPNLDLTALKKMDNIGLHGDDLSALNEARKLYHDPCACYCCFFRHYHDAVLATVGLSTTKTSMH